MSNPLTSDVLQDDVAIALARVMAAANRSAREAGVDIGKSFITITQRFDGGLLWRVNYGPMDYIARRGGDLMVDVNDSDVSIARVIRGQ